MKIFFLFTSFILAVSPLFAQVTITPLKQDPARKSYGESKLRVAASPIDTLPFFDDFTGYRGKPKTELWESSGGVLVNNTYGKNPPSYHVATFDGLDENGLPYNRTDEFAKGQTDKLTSVPLNLSGYDLADSVYLSFYWQGGGFGEAPNPTDGDSLTLEFKNSSGKWEKKWFAQDESTPFYQELIRLDTQFFHNTFQFRFRSYGATSGSYDVWNLDYILLAAGRSSSDTNYADMAILNTPGSLLKDYYAYPYPQFFANWENLVKDTISFNVFNYSTPDNLYLMNNDVGEFNKLTDELTDDLLEEFSIQTFAFGKQGNIVDWEPDYNNIYSLDRPLMLKYLYTPNVTDSVLFKENNSVTDSTILFNYMAYDDHSAEAIVNLNGNGSMAVAYSTLQPDSIIGVAIDFLEYQSDISGLPIEICIWKSVTTGTPDENLIIAREMPLAFSESGQIAKFYFDNPQVVNGDFLVGFRSNLFDKVYVGFDVNSNSSEHIRYKFKGYWFDHNSQAFAPGSLIIRPIFGGNHYEQITGTATEKELNFEIFPNPSNGIFTLNGQVNSIKVLSVTGNEVKNIQLKASRNTSYQPIDLSELPQGVYFLHLFGDKGSFAISKIIISK